MNDKASFYQRLSNEYELLASNCERAIARFENRNYDTSSFQKDLEEYRGASQQYAQTAVAEITDDNIDDIWEEI